MNAGLLYRAGTVAGASPVGLVTRLYEQIVEDLRQAVGALERGDVESRTDKINHAILVLAHLESQLNFAAGGKVAENLRNFYDTLRRHLMRAQIEQSKDLLAQQITDLLAVREAWIEVERAESRVPEVTASLLPAGAPEPTSDGSHADWKA